MDRVRPLIDRSEPRTAAQVVVGYSFPCPDMVEAHTAVLGGRTRSPLGAILRGIASRSVVLAASYPVTVRVR